MAFQMSYTDERGITSAEAYWKLTDVSINTMSCQAVLTFNGYASANARQNRFAPIGTYTCYICNIPADKDADGLDFPANPRFNRFFGTSVMDAAEANVVKQGYLAVLDIPGNPFVEAVEV